MYDIVVTVGFTATAYDVGEGMELQVCVMLTEGLLQREVMVSVSSMNDSAVGKEGGLQCVD